MIACAVGEASQCGHMQRMQGRRGLCDRPAAVAGGWVAAPLTLG